LVADRVSEVRQLDRSERRDDRGVVDQYRRRPELLSDPAKATAQRALVLDMATIAIVISPPPSISATASASSCSERASNATCAPALASPTAIRRPIPRSAPVTTATRSRKAGFGVASLT
jgi:hypothetical protein